MKLITALSALSWLLTSYVMGFPVNKDPYGYAPYVWITVSKCNPQNGWCQGNSRSSFALIVNYNGSRDTWCTHYCPGMIHAHWRPLRSKGDGDDDELENHETEGSFLGAFVRRLDKSSCIPVPGGFPCADRVIADTPLNKISILNPHLLPGAPSCLGGAYEMIPPDYDFIILRGLTVQVSGLYLL